MSQFIALPKKVRWFWGVDLTLFVGGLIAILTGIYFIFLPTGGYQGGRNPLYGIQFIFDRTTWESLHTWSGVAMILLAVTHFIFHWNWVAGTIKLMWSYIFKKADKPGTNVRVNVLVDFVILISFVLSALSGVYFIFSPDKKHSTVIKFLFSPLVWDNLHTWSSIIFITAILVHLILHWKWIRKVTPRVFAPAKKASLNLSMQNTIKE